MQLMTFENKNQLLKENLQLEDYISEMLIGFEQLIWRASFRPNQGRRPRGTGGTVPPKFEVGGTAHALVEMVIYDI